MKKLWFILLLWCPLLAWGGGGLQVSSGRAALLPNPRNVDYVFVFAGLQDAELSTSDNNPKWYKQGNSTPIQQGVNYLQPENNTGYVLQTDNGTASFFVIDRSQYVCEFRRLTVDGEYDNLCKEVRLIPDADVPRMSYTDTLGRVHTLDDAYRCKVSYVSLEFDGEAWQEVQKDTVLPLAPALTVNAPLCKTFFTLYAGPFADELGLPLDSVSSEEYETVAIATHPVSLTTVRGTEEENKMPNEVDRPTESTVLSGSAPLDILFRANGTPLTSYYQWRLYRGQDLLAQRTDAEHRYTFDTYGEYRVVLTASNDYCTADSTEFKISVSESQLLVPNVFTPNGDGKNDEFRVLYRSITDFHCWVYNRWGKKVFEWTDPAKGWDGTINGKRAAESAYFYVIRATGADGKVYKLKGDINLIRGRQ